MRYRSVLTVFALLVLAHTASAASIGVNKGTLSFQNVLNGGYAEDTVTVTTSSEENVTLDYEVTGDIAEWITIQPNTTANRTFSAGEPLQVRIITEPPSDIANGTYSGEIRLLTGEFIESEGRMGSSIRASFGLNVNVGITGDEIRSCTAGGFDIPDTEVRYPLELRSTVENTGNVRVRPNVSVTIWDKYQEEIVATKSTRLSELRPTRRETYFSTVSHDLSPGQYWAEINVSQCNDRQTLTFNVLEIGGVSDQGKLLWIKTESWTDTGDITRIEARFRNEGSRAVNARFKGSISKDDEVVEVIDTDPVQVPPNQVQNLETFFRPEEPGRYDVTGRVIYNNKLTFEKSAQINVEGVEQRVTGGVVQSLTSNPYQTTAVGVSIGILALLGLIVREHRR